MSGYKTCPTCITYAEVRALVLLPAFVARRRETGESGTEILDRYMGGVHTRHLSGLPILPERAAS